jgi:NhaP-type Na+/H+ or K+/H+ antiporter
VNSYLTVYFGIVITVILLAGRYIAVTLVSYKDKILECNRTIMSIVMGRGLAAAVLAEVIRTSGIIGSKVIADIIIVVIISSVVLSTIGVSIIGRNLKRCDGEMKKSEKKISSVKS